MRRENVTASSDMLKILLHYAAQQGIVLATANQHNRPDVTLPESSADRIPIQSLRTVWQEMMRLSNDEDFGLHLGEAAERLTMGSILSSVMMNSATLGSALEKMARYHDLTTDFVRLQLDRQEYVTHLVWQAADESFSLERQYADCVFCGLLLPIERLTQGQVKPAAVHFRYACPADPSELQRICDCPLVFEAPVNRLLLRNSDLETPIFAANAALLNQLESFAQQLLQKLDTGSSWADRVVQKMNVCLARGERPTLEYVAAELAIGTRQLQNRLKQDGVSYRVLLDEIRKETALHYLQDERIPVCDIAFLLGFSEQSAFTHAFKRWTGDTPGNFRRRSSS